MMDSSTIPKLSLVSQFDDLRRYSETLTVGCEAEFRTFVAKQKEIFHHLKDVLEENNELKKNVTNLKEQLKTFKIQIQHLKVTCEKEKTSAELHKRKRRSMENQIVLIKDILIDNSASIDQVKKQFLELNSAQNRHDTIDGSGSLLSSSEVDETDDLKLDLSRPQSRKRRSKRNAGNTARKQKTELIEESLAEMMFVSDVETISCSGRSSSEPRPVPKILNRTVFRSDSDQIQRLPKDIHSTLNSTISFPASRHSLGSKRPHTFASKFIIRAEKCLPCSAPITFGKSALKCHDCKMTCHPECRDKCPLPCLPTPQSPPLGKRGSIAEYCPPISPMIPPLLFHCVNEIESRGLKELGLYRINGRERVIKDLKEKILKGKQFPSLLQIDVHVICGTIKAFLGSLKEPLIPTSAWQDFVDAAGNKDKKSNTESLIQQLPQQNKDSLAFLIMHLKRISDSPECRMPVDNLAKVFGPTIVGNSSSTPQDFHVLSEIQKQQEVMKNILAIPNCFWENILNPDEVFHTSESLQTLMVKTRLGPIRSDVIQIQHSPLEPRCVTGTNKTGRKKFFSSPKFKRNSEALT